MRVLYNYNSMLLDTAEKWLMYMTVSGNQFVVNLSITKELSEAIVSQQECCKVPTYYPKDVSIAKFDEWSSDDNILIDLFNGENRGIIKSKWGVDIMFPSAGGGTDYNDLMNRPSINNVILEANKSFEDLGILTWGTI